jgi:hypothetical protein
MTRNNNRTRKPKTAAGFFNKRQSGLYPPKMRKLLGEVGTEMITSLTVFRKPVESTVTKLLQLLSLGTYEDAVKNSNFDSMFHLALIINGVYTLDKQSVVSFSRTVPSGGEFRQVNLPSNITIQQLVDNTKVKMGNQQFSNYNAVTNNCQVFVSAVLEANGLLTPELSGFISQDAQAVFSKMPQFMPQLAEKVTDLGAWSNKVLEGEGWKAYYTRQTKGKKFGSRQAVNDHMSCCSKAYAQCSKK